MGYLAFPGVSFLKAVLSSLIYEILVSARRTTGSARQTHNPLVYPEFPAYWSSQRARTGTQFGPVALLQSEHWMSAKFCIFETELPTTTSSEPATPDMDTPVCSGLEDRTAVWKAGIAVGSSPIFTAPFQARMARR